MHWLESIAPMVLTEQATSFADTSLKNWIGILKRLLMVRLLLSLETVFCCHFNSKRKGNSSLVSSLFELKQQWYFLFRILKADKMFYSHSQLIFGYGLGNCDWIESLNGTIVIQILRTYLWIVSLKLILLYVLLGHFLNLLGEEKV